MSHHFHYRMLNIIDSKYMGLLDLFESLDQLTLTGNHFVHRSSLFGKLYVLKVVWKAVLSKQLYQCFN